MRVDRRLRGYFLRISRPISSTFVFIRLRSHTLCLKSPPFWLCRLYLQGAPAAIRAADDTKMCDDGLRIQNGLMGVFLLACMSAALRS